jgi:hypothetical protein
VVLVHQGPELLQTRLDLLALLIEKICHWCPFTLFDRVTTYQ